MPIEQTGKRLLSRDDIESEYGLGRRWLELAALKGDGPPMRRISSHMIRYERSELEEWLANKKVASTTQAVA